MAGGVIAEWSVIPKTSGDDRRTEGPMMSNELYTIVSQEQVQTFGPDGTIADVMRVTFRTVNSGQTAYVTVPVDGYSPEAVDTAIRARAPAIDAVQAL